MKTKIILIFFLLTISLFGQFIEVDNGFLMKTTFKDVITEEKTTCYFTLMMNAPERIVIAVDTDTQPTRLSIELFTYYLEDDDPNMLYDKEHGYVIAIYNDSEDNNKYIKYILQNILEKELWINSKNTLCHFDFSKYKKDIIKSKFYKKIMQ